MSEESALKLALKAKAMRAQNAGLIASDPIAIVGMACRVPGADGVDAFWELLRDGVDTVRPIPHDRWDVDVLYDPDIAAIGKSHVREAGLLDRIDGFDAGYFDILPREADQMDPQQRLFLEVAIEALDDAGIPQSQLSGSRTAAFVASYHNDYAGMLYADRDAIDLRTLTGTLHCVLVNRLSYFLDFKGPSVSIDSGCSASLVAVHLACQSLRQGESEVALAGGVSLIVSPDLMLSLSKVGFMAPDGRCKTFDAAADGFGRGEGCGVVVLKRLSDALADGDRVLAVIRGSAVNQDGHSTILTAPSGPAQQALIREGLAAARVDPARIGLVETHGTGTALGDPIEVEAIAAVLGHAGSAPCMLGSVKANIGHLEAAAGVTGLIKAVLALRHEAIPPQVHYRKLSPHIDLSGTRLDVPSRLTPWPAGATLRAAAVSSFGVGGTNAHVILEEAPRLPAPEPADETLWRLLPLSAKSPAALADSETAWRHFAASSDAGIADLCTTAALRRTHYPVRRAVLVRATADIAAGLAAAPSDVVGDRRIAFVFSGQGPQWYAMGRQLTAEEPAFRETIEACDALLKPLSGWSLIEALAAPEAASRVSETEVAQPALFAIQVALAALLQSWGVKPDAVVGHSIGELAALHVAGVLSLQEAIRIVWHRARLMQRATGMGRMALVSLDEAEAETLVRNHPGLDIAACNAPHGVVLSGSGEALDRVLAILDERGVGNRALPVRYAFHSAQMEPLAAELARVLGQVAWQAPRIAFYSTVTGGRAEQGFDATYFARNVRQRVRFAQAITTMAGDGCGLFLEIGPHPILGASIEDTLAAVAPDARVAGTLRRGRDEREMMLRAAGTLFEGGADLDWSAIDPGDGQPVALPPYSWQRKRHWIRQRPTVNTLRPLLHPVVGRRLPTALPDVQIFEGHAADIADWSGDHRIFGKVLMPAAGVMGAFAAAATLVLGDDAEVAGFALARPIVIAESTRWQIIARLQDGAATLELFVADAPDAAWQSAATATATRQPADWPTVSLAIEGLEQPLIAAYEAFEAMGIGFGPAFRLVGRARFGEGSASASIAPIAGAAGAIHPAQIDAALQLCAMAAGEKGTPTDVFLPMGADRIAVRRVDVDGPLEARIKVMRNGATQVADVAIANGRGETVLQIAGARFVRTGREAFGYDEDVYEIGWERASEPVSQRSGDSWLLLEDASGVARAVAARLTAAGQTCWLVRPATAFATADQLDWTIDPANLEHFDRLLALLPAGPLSIAHFWSLDLSAAPSQLDSGDRLGLASALHLVQAAAKRGDTVVRLITRGGQATRDHESPAVLNPLMAGLWGLASAVATEHPEIDLRLIDADPFLVGDELLAAELVDRAGRQIALRDGARLMPRLRRYRQDPAPVPRDRVRVTLTRAGSFEGLSLEPFEPRPLGPGDVRLRVLAAGINFRDILVTLGMYPATQPPLGVECVGVVTECGAQAGRFRVGQRVFGYAPESLATEAIVPEIFLAPVPEGMPAHIAAGIPVAYLTVYHGLHTLAGLKPRERVLIHAAAGGVGLAAVQFALQIGAEVFATAGSPAKRALLTELGVAHVFDSRSTDFADAILAVTSGAGVDVVLNSLAGPFVDASFAVLARGGRFLELGKRDIWQPARAAAERPDAAYHLYDLGAEATAGTVSLAPAFKAITAGLADGSLLPLPVTTYAMKDVADAMRLMAQARHVGKVVLRMAPDETAPFGVSPTGTVLVTGGLGGVGLETAHWLADKGALHLALLGRSAPSPAAEAAVAALEAKGVRVHIIRADVGDLGSLQSALDQIGRDMPPLRGVIHAAGTLHDGVLLDQRWNEAQQVVKAKAHGAHLLDRLTRHLPLDFFILYSAAGMPLGAGGQGLYPAANAELDLLAERRRRLGLPGLSVAWGLWQNIGMAAGMGGRKWEERGLRAIDPKRAFATLERLLGQDAGYAIVAPVDWNRFLGRQPRGLDPDFFAGLAPTTERPTIARRSALAAPSPIDTLRAALPARRRALLLDYLGGQTLQVLGLDAATRLDPAIPLRETGVDSLMSVELRNLLVRATGLPLPATLLFDHPTLDALATCLTAAWQLEGEPARKTEASVLAPTDPGGIETMSDAEAEALLLSELEALDGAKP